VATLALTPSAWSSERRFYFGISVAMAATVFLGFARSFFLRPLFPNWPSPAEPIFYMHGTLFTAWTILFVVQTSLVATGRTPLHRKFGAFGALLALSMVFVGTYGALVAARRETGFVGIPVPGLQFLVVPVVDMVLFATFVGLGVGRRRDTQAHKRWMLLASFNLLTAAIARWPAVITIGGPPLYFALTDLFVVALVVWDRKSQGSVHPVTLWGGSLLVLSQPLRLVVSGTTAWVAFAGWAVGFLG